jgi:multiple antibiotic resistance protein
MARVRDDRVAEVERISQPHRSRAMHPADSGASLTPLVLFAASPGTITGVITLSAAHTGLDLPVTALVAIAVAGLVTWLTLLLVSRVAAKASEGGSARDMVTRFMGLIVWSMGVQFAPTGLHKFWM